MHKYTWDESVFQVQIKAISVIVKNYQKNQYLSVEIRTFWQLSHRVSLFAHEGHEATEGSLATAKFPREAANPHTLVQHIVNLSSSILDVENAVREHIVVHQL